MKNKLYIRPRRQGKTTWIVDEFVGEWHKCKRDGKPLPVLVLHNHSSAGRVKKLLLGIEHSHITTVNPILKNIITIDNLVYGDGFWFRGRIPYCTLKDVTFFIDEIDAFPRAGLRYIWDNDLRYIAITTPRRLYDRETIENMRFWIEHQRRFHKVMIDDDKFMELFNDDEIIYRPIINPHTEVIEWEDPQERMLPPEQYKAQILGKLFI